MSYHSSMRWQFGDDVTENLIDEVFNGLNDNKVYMYGKRFTPSAYSVMSNVDMLIFGLGVFLDQTDAVIRGSVNYSEIEEKLGNAPQEAFEVLSGVLKKLNIIEVI